MIVHADASVGLAGRLIFEIVGARTGTWTSWPRCPEIAARRSTRLDPVSNLIREATLEDVAAIRVLLNELGYAAAPHQVRQRLVHLLGSPMDRVVVVETAAGVVAMAGLHIGPALEYDAPVARLGAVVVAGPWRGRGIGSALLEHLASEARSAGCAQLVLASAEHRRLAHRFYRRAGFEETGRRFARSLRG
jgi:aminoglycoside 6'-N-acetyltransferase I